VNIELLKRAAFVILGAGLGLGGVEIIGVAPAADLDHIREHGQMSAEIKHLAGRIDRLANLIENQ